MSLYRLHSILLAGTCLVVTSAQAACLLNRLDENGNQIACAPLGAGNNISQAEIDWLVKIGMVDEYLGVYSQRKDDPETPCDLSGDIAKVFTQAMARYDDGTRPRGAWYDQILLGASIVDSLRELHKIDACRRLCEHRE
jgi:hypothetical protein